MEYNVNEVRTFSYFSFFLFDRFYLLWQAQVFIWEDRFS